MKTAVHSLILAVLLSVVTPIGVNAAESTGSGFGAISIPKPTKPGNAANCVAPLAVIRRDHMKFLDHQRDTTVIDGVRDGKYSLIACINCHNPTAADGSFVRYSDPQHFCATCHRYASVKIDCFECHSDRGLPRIQQGQVDHLIDPRELSRSSFRQFGEPGED